MKRPPRLLQRQGLVDSVSAALEKGHVALTGPPKCGKSLVLELLKDKLDRRSVIIPLKQIGMTPEFYALFCMNELLRSFDAGLDNAGLDVGVLKSSAEKNCKQIIGFVTELETELQKIKPDYARLITLVKDAFSSVGELVVLYDDADELLNLENFSNVSEVFNLIRSDGLSYVFATSHVNSMTALLSDCRLIEVPLLGKEEAKELVKSEDAIRIAGGHPYLLNRLSHAANEEDIIREMLGPDSAAFQFMSAWIDDALNRARGTTLPKAILQVIAREDGLRLSEIARRIYRPAPVTKSILERLIAADIIMKEDKTFSFSSEALGRWFHIVTSMPEIQSMPDAEGRKRLMKMLEGGA